MRVQRFPPWPDLLKRTTGRHLAEVRRAGQANTLRSRQVYECAPVPQVFDVRGVLIERPIVL
jgi:hypothetical protein